MHSLIKNTPPSNKVRILKCFGTSFRSYFLPRQSLCLLVIETNGEFTENLDYFSLSF
jgi:hypothetical protein